MNTFDLVWRTTINKQVASAKFNSDATRIIFSEANSNKVHVYNKDSPTSFSSAFTAFNAGVGSRVYETGFSLDDTQIIACGSNDKIKVWNISGNSISDERTMNADD